MNRISGKIMRGCFFDARATFEGAWVLLKLSCIHLFHNT
jgi:hypothetical protein